MHITIENYRGISAASIELDSLTLVTGSNAAGKTSVVQAVAAALTGQAVPLAGMRKSDAGALVHTGAAGGKVILTGDVGSTEITWPAAKVSTTGTPPQATAIAAGLDHLLDHPTRERSQILQRYLAARPSYDDLFAALDGMDEDQVAQVWERIRINDTPEKSGWDVAHAEAKDRMARLKGQWEQATGDRRYGERKAASWVPTGWEEDLASASQDSLEEAVTREREYLEAQISVQAVSQDERDRVAAEAATLEQRQADFAAAQTEKSQADEALAAARARRADLPGAGPDEKTTPCPHCKEPVVIRTHHRDGHTLTKPTADAPDEREAKRRRQEIAQADGQVENARARTSDAQRAIRQAEDAVEAAEAAAAKLEDMTTEGADPAVLEQARERVRVAEQRLKAWRQYDEALRLHRAVQTQGQIVAVLAPEGLRARKLRDAAWAFGESHVSAVCRAAGWPRITFDDNFAPSLGGRPYGLLSESEQYRVRAAVQIAMALIDGSDAVLLDGVELLDRAGRNGLAQAMVACPTPILAALTTEDAGRNPPPDLDAVGKGRTYWIADGTARPWSEMMKEAA